MEHIANLGGTVTGFDVVGPYIDCMCGRDLLKIEKHSGDIIYKKRFLKKRDSQEI